MTLTDRIQAWFRAIRDLEEEFVWSEWHERVRHNALPVMIVFIFLSGLGSCVVFAGKTALEQAQKTPAIQKQNQQGSSQNPWSLDETPTDVRPH